MRAQKKSRVRWWAKEKAPFQPRLLLLAKPSPKSSLAGPLPPGTPPKKMQLAALFDVLADPTVASVSVEIHSESVGELHAELLHLYMYCLSRVVGALDLARVTAEHTRLVGEYFSKFGVRCHVDGNPPVPATELARHAAWVTVRAHAHSLHFSCMPPPRVPCSESALRRGV